MFSKFYDLYTTEWYKIIKPFGLLDKLLQFISILIPIFNNKVDKILLYKYKLLNKRYSFITINKKDITYITDYESIANYKEYPFLKDYKYAVHNIADNVEMLGCGFTDFIALRGLDYIIHKNVYFFKEHPSKYCYTFCKSNTVIYKTVGCVGNKCGIPNVYSIKTQASTDISACLYDAIRKTCTVTSCNFIDTYLQGIYCTDGIHGKVVDLWHYGNYKFAILDSGSFIAADKNSNIELQLQKKPIIDNTPKYFTVCLGDKIYPVYQGTNKIINYPNIKTYYPTLRIINDLFLGIDLYNLIQHDGYKFTKIPQINCNTYDNKFLEQFINYGDRLMYLGDLYISKDLTYASEVKTNTYNTTPSTSFSITAVDIKYLY